MNALHTRLDAVRKPVFWFMALAFLTSCGSSIKARDGALSSASRSAVSECNYFESGASRLSGKVTTYYYNGTIQEDRVRLRLTGLDASFSSSSNVFVQFFRWRVGANGQAELDATPLQFKLEKDSLGGTGSTSFTDAATAINITSVAQYRAAGGIPGTTTQEFFDNVSFTILGTDYNWSALKAVLYDGSTVVGQADMLLPVFSANPNTYAASHSPILNALHPFYAQRSQEASDADWVNRSRSFCF